MTVLRIKSTGGDSGKGETFQTLSSIVRHRSASMKAATLDFTMKADAFSDDNHTDVRVTLEFS